MNSAASSASLETDSMKSGLVAALRQLSSYIRRNRRTYMLWAFTTLGYVACFVSLPILTGYAISAIEHGLGDQEVGKRALWILLVALLRGGFRFYSRTIVFNGARQIEYEIRNDLFAHFQRLPQSFFSSKSTGDLMSRCVNDLNSVRLLLGPGLLNLFQTPILLIAVFSAMIAIDPVLALAAIAPYPLFILLARGVGKGMHRWNIAVQEGLAALSSVLQETIAGIAVVKAYAMEPMTERQFESVNQELYRRQLRLVRINAGLPTTASVLPAVTMWIVLLVGGNEVVNQRMELSAFFTFAMYAYELTFPTFILGWVAALLQRGAVGMQRINEILCVEPTIADREDVVEVDQLRGEIEFRNLSFRYLGEQRHPALHEISLHIPAGTTLGVVGPIGSGKTTLASMVPRLCEVPDGTLLIDDIDINRIPLHTLRSSIAMVPQDPFLFSMSLADNIAYGLPETDLARVEEAAERAQLAADIEELPQGLATLVGERGVMLSGGQRQRASLARALALRPQILILDDTLSSVDAATEEAILEQLREVFRGRTVIVITHRVSVVSGADQILVLDEGAIVERGRHAELLARKGLYARLAREQEIEEVAS